MVKRYTSIDFLRGFAIILMILLHTIMRWYDRTWIKQGDTSNVPVIILVVFIVLLFIGGWAGFFLMVSAIANMISMQRNLEKGRPVKEIATKQVIGGILLLIFAMLTEAIIGYHGAVGELALGNLDGWSVMLWRAYHMETIHAVAWCVIINGLVQAALSRNGGYEKVDRNLKIYALLAIICVALTIPMWELAKFIVPGYPMATNPETGVEVQYPYIGKSEPYEYILLFILLPLAGQPEPLFPFLAVSFIGSIIGIYLCQEEPDQDFPRRGMYIGFIIFLVGLFGVILVILLGVENINNFINYYFSLPGLYPNSWFWWFLCVTGVQITAILLLIRLVEYRGKSEEFGEKTTFFRRFGFVAFTVYTFQFFDVIPRILYGLLPNVPDYPRKMGAQVIFLIIFVFIFWHIILKLWEKVDYAFGMEWCIAKIAEGILPGEKQKNKHGWQVKRLNVQTMFYNVEWINIVKETEIAHDQLKESKLAYKLSILGFLFFPLSAIAFIIARDSMGIEEVNKYNQRAVKISIAGLIFIIILVIVLSLITGISF